MMRYAVAADRGKRKSMSKIWAALDCNNVMQQRWWLLDLLLAVTGSGGWVKGTKAQPADGAGGTCANRVGLLPPGVVSFTTGAKNTHLIRMSR
jgi:hypothetical protein